MFTFNILKTENFKKKKKELNKQHDSSFLCISSVFCLFLSSFHCLGVWRRGAEVRKNCFKTGKVNSVCCAPGVRGSCFQSSPDWWNSSCSARVLPMQWIPAGKASLLSCKPQKGSGAPFLVYNSISQVTFLIWGVGFAHVIAFFVAALIVQFYVAKR